MDDVLQLWHVHKRWSQIVTRSLHLVATNKSKEFILRNIFPTKWSFALVYLVGDHLGQNIELQRKSGNGR